MVHQRTFVLPPTREAGCMSDETLPFDPEAPGALEIACSTRCASERSFRLC